MKLKKDVESKLLSLSIFFGVDPIKLLNKMIEDTFEGVHNNQTEHDKKKLRALYSLNFDSYDENDLDVF